MFTCLGCGVKMKGRPARKFCSNRCQRALERRQRLTRWLETGEAFVASTAGHYIRTYLLEQQGGRCALCNGSNEWNGKSLNLVMDHIDGDPTNSRRENLRLICPNCDSQLPTYKSRNMGRGRHSRRQRYAEGKSY
jgi:5-methylcytosine-specific restriction endonuclease McrA